MTASISAMRKLAVVLVAFVEVNLLFLSIDRTPPEWDQSAHMLTAAQYHAAMQADSGPGLAGLRRMLGRIVRVDTGIYPPAFSFLSSWLLFFGPLTVQWMALVNLPLVVLLALSVFGLGRRIDRSSNNTGVLGAALLLLYPIVFGLSRAFMIDFAALAASALAGYLLLRTEEFRRPGFTLLFGLCLGVGLLIKQSVITAMVTPSLYVVASALARCVRGEVTPQELGRRTMLLIGAGLVGVLVAIPWYAHHADAIPAMLAVSRTNTTGFAVLEPASLLWLARSLTFQQMGWLLAGVFGVGLLSFWHRTDAWHSGFLLSWIIGIYLIAIVVPHKSDRQYVAILVPAALVSALALIDLKRWRTAAIGLVCGYGAIQLLAFSLPPSTLASELKVVSRGNRYPWAWPPDRRSWSIESALDSLPLRPASVAVVSDHHFINGQVVGYYAKIAKRPLIIVKCHNHLEAFLRDPLQYDYFVTKTDWAPTEDPGDNPFTPRDTDVQIERAFVAIKDKLRLRSRFPLPDGSALLLFERRDPPIG